MAAQKVRLRLKLLRSKKVMKKRIRVNTTFAEDGEEIRQYFAGLSYSERLRHFFKLRNLLNFHGRLNRQPGLILKIYHSHEESQ